MSRLLCLYSALLVLLLTGNCQADSTAQKEYQVKAAFLYNFARFTSWPPSDSRTFRLCILGNDPFNGSVDSLHDKPVHDQLLNVSRIEKVSEAENCQILFISKSLFDQVDEIITALGNRPALTVSDMDNFIDHGGIIGFLLVDNKIRFEINTAESSKTGLSISSRLLTLATTVKTDR
jgi:hypothetical protein